MLTEEAARQCLVEIGRSMADRGHVAGRQGNLSARLGGGGFLVSPAGKSLGGMAPDDLVVLDGKGRVVGVGCPTSELALHLALYESRPDVGGIIHGHSPFASAYAVAERALPADRLEELKGLGPIPLISRAPPGSVALATAAAEAMRSARVGLLAGHGVLALGAEPEEAWWALEALESGARVLWLADRLEG